MAGKFQDDERELMMCRLFGLRKDETQGRSGIDAFLDIGSLSIPFELKTTSKGSVTTVRDFGEDHIRKWEDKHWLIGFFHGGDPYYVYASPHDMSGWIDEKAQYIAPDIKLASIASARLDYDDLDEVLGYKEFYTLEDAKSLHKRQYSEREYREKMDLRGGYSRRRMLEILKERTTYIMARGSTLNNPHIPLSYFEDAFRIDKDHPEQLRALVAAYLAKNNVSF